jgi:protein-tyrosine phosphatase
LDSITNEIVVGDYLEAQNAACLRHHGIRSVLSLDGTLAENDAKRLGLEMIVAIRLTDGAGNDIRVLQRAVESLGELVRSYPPVLVQCHAGRSRSIVVVAGHLAKSHNIEPVEAVALVAEKRDVNVTPALIELLERL